MRKLITCAFVLVFPMVLIAGGNSARYLKKKKILKMMEKVADWQLEHPKWKLYEWHNAPLYNGVFETYKTTGKKKYYEACKQMMESNEYKPGPRWFHADDIAIGQTYVEMYNLDKEEKYLKSLRDTIDKMFTVEPRFNKDREDWKKCFWYWCDALYMAPPTLIKLGVATGEDKYLRLSDELYKETIDYLWNDDECLFARDMRYVWGAGYVEEDHKENNGRRIFWSRGNGWVLGGLVMILKDLPDDWTTKKKYEELYKKMAEKVAGLQPEDGLWRAGLLDADSYPHGETSGSSFITYALAYGVNSGILDRKKYMPVIKKSWAALNKCVNKDGMLGFAQPVGAAPQRNFSQSDWEVYASGAFLLAASEVIRLND